MNIVTVAGTGRHLASWRAWPATTPVGVMATCEQGSGQQLSPRARQRDLGNLPTPDPQRASAPRRWDP